MKKASSKLSGARISLKHSLVLCKELKGKKIDRARKFLEDLLARKINLDGKFYTKAASKFLEMLKTVEANARQKNLNPERLFIKKIKADKGLRFYRPRSLWHLRRQRAKAVNLMIEVEER
jgi:large subunit ribosomal protein L22